MNTENDWTVYRTRFLVCARQLTEPLNFTDALGREHTGEAGDYLVESSEGCFRITPRKIFEDVYVPLHAPPTENSTEAAAIESALYAGVNGKQAPAYSCGGVEGMARARA